jgi:hypothetical protein
LVTKRDDNSGEWQLSVGRDVAPGFYDVVSVLPTGADPTTLVGSYEILADLRGCDLSGEGYRPDIVSAAEAAYTVYQTAVIRFHDTQTNTSGLSVGATATYDVVFRLANGLQDLQTWVESEDFRYHGGDSLIRAAIPCFLDVAFVVEQPATQDVVDTALLAGQISESINTQGFAGKVAASRITELAYQFFEKPSIVRSVELLGRIRYPSGRWETIFSRDVLAIPREPGEMVSPKTVVFYLPPAAVRISVLRT